MAIKCMYIFVVLFSDHAATCRAVPGDVLTSQLNTRYVLEDVLEA